MASWREGGRDDQWIEDVVRSCVLAASGAAEDEIKRLRAAMEEAWQAPRPEGCRAILFQALWPGHNAECRRYYDGPFECHPDCEVARA